MTVSQVELGVWLPIFSFQVPVSTRVKPLQAPPAKGLRVAIC